MLSRGGFPPKVAILVKNFPITHALKIFNLNQVNNGVNCPEQPCVIEIEDFADSVQY